MPPYIVYSPETLTITQDGDETVLIPALKIESLTIIESLLTEDDIESLEWTHKGEGFIESLDAEDYVNLALALIQMVLIPATVVWIYRMARQKRLVKGLVDAVHGPDKRTIYKRNYSKVKGRDVPRT